MSYVEHDENMQRQSLTFLASYDYVNSYCKKKPFYTIYSRLYNNNNKTEGKCNRNIFHFARKFDLLSIFLEQRKYIKQNM